jgi:hypothetical protein
MSPYLDLTFALFPSITNKMQRYKIYLFLGNGLHVSGGAPTHHQELKTVNTASGTCQTFTAARRKILTSTRCCIYSFELLMMGGGIA